MLKGSSNEAVTEVRAKGEADNHHRGQKGGGEDSLHMGHLPLQVDFCLPQGAQPRVGWTVSKGSLMTSSIWVSLFYKGVYNCISMLSLLLLWQVLQEFRTADVS